MRQVTLPADLDQWITAQVEAGRWSRADALIEKAILGYRLATDTFRESLEQAAKGPFISSEKFHKQMDGWIASLELEVEAREMRPIADRAFACLLSLVGAWRGETAEGRALEVSYRLIANETALVETWTLAPGREAMTIYHRNDADLVAAHFCPLGVHPKLRFEPGANEQRLDFHYDGFGVANERAPRQDSFWLEIEGNDAFTRSETYRSGDDTQTELAVFSRTR